MIPKFTPEQREADKVLADKAVVILEDYILSHGNEKMGPYIIRLNDNETASYVVRDWRVAGALMEKCCEVQCGYIVEDQRENLGSVWATVWMPENQPLRTTTHDESLPHAIIEACVGALEEK